MNFSGLGAQVLRTAVLVVALFRIALKQLLLHSPYTHDRNTPVLYGTVLATRYPGKVYVRTGRGFLLNLQPTGLTFVVESDNKVLPTASHGVFVRQELPYKTRILNHLLMEHQALREHCRGFLSCFEGATGITWTPYQGTSHGT